MGIVCVEMKDFGSFLGGVKVGAGTFGLLVLLVRSIDVNNDERLGGVVYF